MKIFFLSVICLSLVSTGVLSVTRLKTREKTLSELSHLLKYMARSIKDSRRELTDIYIAFDSPHLDKIGFSATLGSLGFKEAVRKLDIPKDCKLTLYSFSSSLGKTFAQDQIASCLSASEELDTVCNKMKNEYPEKRNIYIGLSFLLAAALFIIYI